MSIAPEGGIPRAYSPKRPVSCTVVRRPGCLTLIAIEDPQYLLVVSVRVLERAVRVEDEVLPPVLEAPLLDLGLEPVELLAVYAAVVPDVAGLREDDGVLEVLQALLHVEHRERRPAEELVAARALDRVDDREAAAEAEGAFGGVGAGPHVLGDLDLLLRRHELVAPGQPRHEPDHGHQPRRAQECLDESFLRVEAVYAGRVLEVGGIRILVPIAEAHQGLVGPGIFDHHRHVHDHGLELKTVNVADLLVYLLEA